MREARFSATLTFSAMGIVFFFFSGCCCCALASMKILAAAPEAYCW
jgi:hypothetical protein